MRLKNRRGRISATVDMTPMIDIVFQLIIFFFVSTTFAVVPGIKLNLPKSTTAEASTLQGITIYADEDGLMFFNDKEVSMETLGDQLLSFDTGDLKKDEFPVTLEADSLVTNGEIVSIFDVIRKSGYSVINLRTSPEK